MTGTNHPLSTVPVYTALGKGISGQRSHGKENSTNTLAYVAGKPSSFSSFPASPHTCSLQRPEHHEELPPKGRWQHHGKTPRELSELQCSSKSKKHQMAGVRGAHDRSLPAYLVTSPRSLVPGAKSSMQRCKCPPCLLEELSWGLQGLLRAPSGLLTPGASEPGVSAPP